MATTHEYPVKVEWNGGRGGNGTVTAGHSGTKNALNVPPEFKGPGGGTNPEELLSSAIAGCYSITFGIIAENRKLPIQSFTVEATGEVEENGPSLKYTAITLRPNIVLTSDATDDQIKIAEDMAHKADGYCIITNAVRGNVKIEVEPTVTKA
jgi:peroxiredoxin-like protein